MSRDAILRVLAVTSLIFFYPSSFFRPFDVSEPSERFLTILYLLDSFTSVLSILSHVSFGYKWLFWSLQNNGPTNASYECSPFQSQKHIKTRVSAGISYTHTRTNIHTGVYVIYQPLDWWPLFVLSHLNVTDTSLNVYASTSSSDNIYFFNCYHYIVIRAV